MDFLDHAREVIKKTLEDLTIVPFAHGDIQFETVFDREKDRYLLMILGWEGIKRVHGCLVQFDIIDGKIWVQRDGVEYGAVTTLLEAGIPQEKIVMGYRPLVTRKAMDGFAIS